MGLSLTSLFLFIEFFEKVYGIKDRQHIVRIGLSYGQERLAGCNRHSFPHLMFLSTGNAHSIDKCPVLTAQVRDVIFLTPLDNLQMLSGDRFVLDVDLVIRCPPDKNRLFIHFKGPALVRSVHNVDFGHTPGSSVRKAKGDFV